MTVFSIRAGGRRNSPAISRQLAAYLTIHLIKSATNCETIEENTSQFRSTQNWTSDKTLLCFRLFRV